MPTVDDIAWLGGWEGYRVSAVERTAGARPEVVIFLSPACHRAPICDGCGASVYGVHDSVVRRIRDLPILDARTWLDVPRRRVSCPRCGPSLAPRDQRTEWAYIFGAICPAKGKGAGLVMPWCDTDAMAAHLIEISAAVDPGAHAVLIVDQAGWHLTPKLAIPDNITVLALPPRSPELNPVENVWQFMRDNWLSNRIFKSYEDIVALCCQAWNNLIDQPWKIMSLGMRKWAHGF